MDMTDLQRAIDTLVEVWGKVYSIYKRDGGCSEQGVWSFDT